VKNGWKERILTVYFSDRNIATFVSSEYDWYWETVSTLVIRHKKGVLVAKTSGNFAVKETYFLIMKV
jgi:predicted transcriptional regulator